MSALLGIKPPPSHSAAGEWPTAVSVFELFSPLLFGAVGTVEALYAQLPTGTRCVALEMHRFIMIDTSGIDALQQLHRRLQRSGILLVLANVNPQTLGLIQRSGFEVELGAENNLPSVAGRRGAKRQRFSGCAATAIAIGLRRALTPEAGVTRIADQVCARGTRARCLCRPAIKPRHRATSASVPGSGTAASSPCSL